VATFLATLVASGVHAQVSTAQRWEFNDPSVLALSAVANSGPYPAQWSAGIPTSTATNAAGSLRMGYNGSSTVTSYAPLTFPASHVGGVVSGTVVFKDWRITNGADSGSARPIYNFALRSAASSSNSLVADMQFTATTAGVVLVVRDSANIYPIATLPAVLPGPLSVTLLVDKSNTIKTYTLSYSVDVPGGEKFTQTGTIGGSSAGRAINYASLTISGNFPNGSSNVGPLIDSIEIASGPAPVVTIGEPSDGRPGIPSNLLSYLNGNRVQSSRPPVGGPGLVLMGGGKEVNAAFTNRAYPIINGGDIVVLRASGTNGYQSYLYNTLVQELPAELRTALQPNSVETLLVDSRAKAESAYVANAVARANMVWMAGGDQSAYIANWRDTALSRAVQAAYERGAVIGGTSAGMVVSGEWMYDPGPVLAATSAIAIADPYGPSMVLSGTKLFDLPLGFNLINEPHFANRDRMGRLMTFMARLRKDARTSLIYGVALDEGTSLFIDKNKLGTFQFHHVDGKPDGSGYILKEDRRKTALVQVSPGLPLFYRNVQRIKLAPFQTFDFARGLSAQTPTLISAEGVIPTNPY